MNFNKVLTIVFGGLLFANVTFADVAELNLTEDINVVKTDINELNVAENELDIAVEVELEEIIKDAAEKVEALMEDEEVLKEASELVAQEVQAGRLKDKKGKGQSKLVKAAAAAIAIGALVTGGYFCFKGFKKDKASTEAKTDDVKEVVSSDPVNPADSTEPTGTASTTEEPAEPSTEA